MLKNNLFSLISRRKQQYLNVYLKRNLNKRSRYEPPNLQFFLNGGGICILLPILTSVACSRADAAAWAAIFAALSTILWTCTMAAADKKITAQLLLKSTKSNYLQLAERENLWRRKIKTKTLPGHTGVSAKKFIPIGPTVWPAIRNKYMNVLFYYIDINLN